MKSRQIVQELLIHVELDSPTEDALKQINSFFDQHGENNLHLVKHAIEKELQGAQECLCTGCVVDIITYEWFLG